MPISHEHKLIFIHNPKTAGTSIMNYFDMDVRTHDFSTSSRAKFSKYWNNYKKFVVIRNPWDRFYSSFKYSKNEESYYHSLNDDKPIHPDYHIIKNMKFDEFVEFFGYNRHLLRHQQWYPQKRYWMDGVEIIRYEHLNSDLSKFLDKEINLPYDNKSTHIDYRDAYNTYLIEKVYSYYKMDVDFFNYEF